MQHDWMIYGANGYTGRLIVQEAVRRGARPLLAGRNAAAIRSLAEQAGCRWRAFALDVPERIAEATKDMQVVLNCAGPFSATAGPLMQGCLSSKAHYLDITGEIDVIEMAARLDQSARQAGIAIIPAVGFDVVPTDCLAAMLAERLPGAVCLQLAFAADNGISPGTAKTVAENVHRGGRIRREGKIVAVPTAWKSMEVAFDDQVRTVVTIPWGDVASAWHSTGIPNIEVYLAVSRRAAAWMRRRLRGLARLAGLPLVQRLAKRWIARRVRGPADEALLAGRAHVWGRVADMQGRQLTAVMQTPAAYQLTRLTALSAVEKILARPPASGFFTPSRAFGSQMITEIPGVELTFR
jgi:short subunit dehydrogenase-like uncharacterized protein